VTRTARVTYGRGEDSPAIISGPLGNFVVAHNGNAAPANFSLSTGPRWIADGTDVELIERARRLAEGSEAL